MYLCAVLLAIAHGGCEPAPREAFSRARPLPNIASPTTVAPDWNAAQRAEALRAGASIFAAHQCTRCHSIDDLPGAGRGFDCVSCHKYLVGLRPDDPEHHRLSAKYGREVIERYQKNIDHFLDVPSLSAIGERVRVRWLKDYLRAPFDLRPALEESMIRHRLSTSEIDAVGRYFAAVANVPVPSSDRDTLAAPDLILPPSRARLEQGAERFRAAGCPTCHAFGNIDFGVAASTLLGNATAKLAPNLRFTRSRTRRDRIVQWIFDPSSLKPDTIMPKLVPERADAELIADFLRYGDPGPDLPVPASLPPPPASSAHVGWEEVKAEVLGKVCVHCHMDDGEADCGPGNCGGLGYAGVKLSFRTYGSTVRGAVDPQGRSYSVLEPIAGEPLPRILQAIMRRRGENLRDHRRPREDVATTAVSGEAPGMPLGLPALTDAQIALLRRWLELDCPGPQTRSGRRGITNGYLIADGPIARNHGCGLRPATPTVHQAR
jgi:hypothetical protein